MDIDQKRRIVGVLVLLFLTLALLLMLYHFNARHLLLGRYRANLRPIPKAPAKPQLPHVKPVMPSHPPLRQRSKAGHLPSPRGLFFVPPTGWTLQLGVFKHEENAKAWLVRLTGLGYKPKMTRQQGHQHARWHVYVGPWTDQRGAKKAQKNIAKRLHIKGMFVRAVS